MDLSTTKYNNNQHLMLDIETFAKTKNATIASISCVQFNPLTGETFSEFEQFIDIQSQLDAGFDVDASTISFWMGGEDTVRKQIVDGCKTGKSIYEVLHNLSAYIKSNNLLYLWGKGPSFDCALLQNAYDRCKIERPWDFWNEYCVRTILAFDKTAKEIPFIGNQHNGSDDCKHQIRMVTANLQKISN